ncbi:MAG: DUF3825 domain-containing protein [Bacteroidota bacterium]
MSRSKYPLFQFSWFSNFRQTLEDLRNLAVSEDWEYQRSKAQRNAILFNYIHHTFTRLREEKKTIEKRIKRNDKTAIPQYFRGKVQLLIPLCLESRGKADLALVVSKVGQVYRASTCLSLDMAINNARLIAKPDDDWLVP